MHIFWKKIGLFIGYVKMNKVLQNTLPLHQYTCSDSQEHCHMLLDAFHGLPVLSFQLSVRSKKHKTADKSQVGTLRGMGNNWGFAPGQEVSLDEEHVAGGIVMVKLDHVFDVGPHMCDLAFQSLECLQVKR